LPIGNRTSQFWANVYLNEVDQFVKRELKCPHYVRYVDDLVLLAEQPDTLLRWREAITEFLGAHLRLALRAEPATPCRVQRGVDFVGWKTWWSHRVPRRRTLANVTERVRRFERAAMRPVLGGAALAIDLRRQGDDGSVGGLRTSLASYGGHLRHGAAWQEWYRTWASFSWLSAVLVPSGWHLRRRWSDRALAQAATLRAQHARLVRHAGERTLVFCQVGRFIEFHGSQRAPAERVLGLRRARLHRGAFLFGAGFPVQLSPRYLRRATRAGWVVLHVAEVRPLPGCVRTRVPVRLIVPCGGGQDRRLPSGVSR
jgi:hypothetical protein